MKPPQQFFEDYVKMRTYMDWAQAGLGKGDDVAQAKNFVGEFRTFYQKWQPQITDPKFIKGLEAVRRGMEGMEQKLETIYLMHLLEVIEAREEWWVAEKLLESDVIFIKLMKLAPPELRPEMEKIHRDHMGKDFEPISYYQQSEADTVESEAKYRKALAGFEVDWEERIDAALREKLGIADGVNYKEWQAEVSAQIAKVGQKIA